MSKKKTTEERIKEIIEEQRKQFEMLSECLSLALERADLLHKEVGDSIE